MIEVKNLSKKYSRIYVLRDINFKVKAYEIFTIFGPSGSGKTTLLRLIAGFEKPDEGEILINGKIVSAKDRLLPPYKRKISMIFQNLALWPHMTVREHLEFVINKEKSKEEKVEDILEKVKLTGFENRYPHELSGGEKQRLAIARALISNPSILLMDEPFTHLDFFLKKEIITLILKLIKNFKITVIYVTHNLDEIKAISDRIIVINKGKIIFQGYKEEFFKDLIKYEKDWFYNFS